MEEIEIAEGVRFVPSFNMRNQSKPSEELAIAIAQDEKTNEILMAASVSRKAIEQTLRTGVMHFWAPTGIWNIGAMSGDPLMAKDMLVDCDQDAIIYRGQKSRGRAETDFTAITNLNDLKGGSETDLIDMARVGAGADFFPRFNMRSPLSPEEELILTIAQDVESKEVLMAAFANRAAIEATLQKRKATFFSRSRGPWTKGETSGNALILEEMLTNRAQEAVIYGVRKEKGGACHRNKRDTEIPRESCFYREVENLQGLKGQEGDLISMAKLRFVSGQE